MEELRSPGGKPISTDTSHHLPPHSSEPPSSWAIGGMLLIGATIEGVLIYKVTQASALILPTIACGFLGAGALITYLALATNRSGTNT
jgi:hypothetical protein